MLAALTAWAGVKTLLPWARAERARRIKALDSSGISVRPDEPRLGNALDLHLVSWKLMATSWKIREELPFTIDDLS